MKEKTQGWKILKNSISYMAIEIMKLENSFFYSTDALSGLVVRKFYI